MAVITFQRPGDAAAARARYDGKFIDGSKLSSLTTLVQLASFVYFYIGRSIKIEIVIDSDTEVGPAPAPPVPSLLGRIGKAAGTPKTGLPASQSQVLNKNITSM